jgi:hypothetical protein
MYGYEPPVTDASKANEQYTENVQLECELVFPALKRSELAHFLDHAVVSTFVLLN